MNDVTLLECKDANHFINSSATWKFYPVDSKTDVTIYYNAFQLVNKPDHYHVNHSREQGQYDLIINRTRREDAGVYACLVAKKDHRAKLIVLGNYEPRVDYWTELTSSTVQRKSPCLSLLGTFLKLLLRVYFIPVVCLFCE